jgi:hypothetical protein
MRRALGLLAAGAFATACLALSGCGLRDPYAARPAARVSKSSSSTTQAQQQTVATPAESHDFPELIARFAGLWANWSAPTLQRQRSELLGLATGALARELRAQNAEARKEQLLAVSRAYSRGRYVGQIARGGGAALVLTYEEVSPLGGQPQGGYRVYLARGERTAAGWKLGEWQPASDG